DTPQALRDLSFSLDRLGNTEQAAGNLDAARTAYTRSLDLRERLATQLATPQALRDLSIGLDSVGDIDRTADNLDPAPHHSPPTALPSVSPPRPPPIPAPPQALRALSFSLDRLGNTERAAATLDAARTAYTRSLDPPERLATHLATPQALRDLSIGLDNVGN